MNSHIEPAQHLIMNLQITNMSRLLTGVTLFTRLVVNLSVVADMSCIALSITAEVFCDGAKRSAQ